MAAFIGFLTALASSYAGQFIGLFQSGQMLEWLSTVAASCLVGYFYAVFARKSL
jgi:fluoride ion exporter CrcB/FEX